MSDTGKTPTEQAYCDLLTGPLPRTALDYRRAIVQAALIGRQLEHEQTAPVLSDRNLTPVTVEVSELNADDLLFCHIRLQPGNH